MATFIANLKCAKCDTPGAYDTPTPLCPECREAEQPKPDADDDGN